MKTLHNLTLILHKLYIQRTSCKPSKRCRWSNYGLGLLMLFIILVGSMQVKADTYFNPADPYWLSVTKQSGWQGYSCVDFKILAYDYYGYDDRMTQITISYFDDLTQKYVQILDYMIAKSANSYDRWDGANNSTLGYIANRNCIGTGDQKWTTFQWFYPQSLIGKTVKFKVFYWWERDYYSSNVDKGTYYDLKIDLPVYKPTAITNPVLKVINGTSDNKWFNFSWTSYDATLGTTNLELYDSPSYTNRIYNSTVVNGGAGSVSLVLGKLNKVNAVWPKLVLTLNTGGETKTYSTPMDSVTTTGFYYPSLNNINFDACSKWVTLNWANNAPAKLDPNSKIFIYRKKTNDDLGVYTLLTPTGLDNKVLQYIDKDVSLDWDQSYSYIIRSCPDIILTGGVTANSSNLTNPKALNYMPELLVSASIITKRETLKFNDFTVTPHIIVGNNAAYAELRWAKVSTCTTNLPTLTVVRVNALNTDDIVTQQISSSSSLRYIDNTVVNNNPYKYCLVANNNGRPDSSAWVNVNIVDQCKFLRFTTTKGVLNDRVRLSWEIDKPQLNKKFVISRKIYDNNSKAFDYEPVAELQSTNSIENWEDLSVAPGILYKYKVESYYQPPTGSAILVSTVDSIGNGLGFSQPIGTISGNVVYGSGTAVEGVNVSVINTNADQKLYNSLKFSQTGAQGTVALKTNKHGCIASGFTWQAFIRPADRNQVKATIYEMQDEYSIRTEGQAIEVFVNDYSLTTPLITTSIFEIPESKFFQLTVSYDKTTKYMKIYINGVCTASKMLIGSSICKGRKEAKLASSYSNGNNYKGWIDEMRLWNKTLSDTEIKLNFDRYLAGSETDLIGYWQMDEGIEGFAFDKSNVSKSYNENHIILSGTECSDSVPTFAQLSIKALTDINGNYIIQGVPYKGNGSTYDVAPILGTHIFEPARQQIFIGGTSSEVQSKINFKDISSFTIKGSIFYENTNYPVAGVEFAVDGNTCTRDNKILVSAADGSYSIDVPIGEHKISLIKNGHIFADSDPTATLKMNLKYNFKENKSNINFTDVTKLTLVGRVVGGAIQATKPIGFNRSIANIGKATIRIQPKDFGTYQLYYDPNITSTSIPLILNGVKNINSVSKINFKSDIIEITTDSINGEFALQVPPIPMKSISIQTDNLVTSDFKGGLPSIELTPGLTFQDTIHSVLMVGGAPKTVIDSCVYHQRLNLTYQDPKPTFIIKDMNYTCNAYGDTIYNYVDPNNELNNTSMPLFTTVNGVVSYAKGYPVFTQNNIYSFQVKAYELYKRSGKSYKDSVDIVPLSNAKFQIQNNLSTNTSKTDYSLNSKGEYIYKFLAGKPVLTGDYAMGMTANLNLNGDLQEWKNGTDTGIRGIVLGAVPSGGVDFVTKGPDKVIAVLRDPPGSNSFATLEKGSTITNTRSYKGIGTESTSNKFIANLGGEVHLNLWTTEIVTETTKDIGGGIEQSVTGSDATSRVESYSTTETISTSSSPDYVGANGDVYIANSSNIGFSKSTQLSLIPKAGKLEFNKPVGYIFVDLGDTTSFRYTQNHILSKLIPEFKRLRESILQTVEDPNNGHSQTSRSQYFTTKKTTDLDFGQKGTYTWLEPNSVTKPVIDSVLFYTNQINNWEGIIRRNEMEKLWAAKKSPVGYQSSINYDNLNLSFDAGTELSKSITRTSSCEQTNEVAWDLNVVGVASLGFNVNKFGFTIESEVKAGGGEEKSSSDATENTITYGYTLSDPDAGNYFSVDVLTPKSHTVYPTADIDMNKKITSYEVTNVEYEGGPIFVTRGGATSCPYEKGDSTLFYKNSSNKSEALSTPTLQIEKPGLEVLVPTVGGIASGKQATYELVLQNLSESNTASWLQLSVDPASNPHGAIVSIDGTPLTEPRSFLVTNDQPMHKAIRLTQSSTDDLDFEDIRLVLSSPCQSDIMAEQKISAHFIPICSDLTLQSDLQTVNSDSQNTSLTLILKDFDPNYKNFGGIVLEYKGANELNWRRIKEFVIKDRESLMDKKPTNPIILEPNQSSYKYIFPMADEPDQTYQFRATAICNKVNQVVAPIITVIKDVKRPQSMGLPSPSNGILTPEAEVSVTFNERIQPEKIASTDIQVYGVLNEYTQTDNVGLQFDGKQVASTELPLSLQGSFTIEGKVLIDKKNTTGTIFSLGEGKNKIALEAVGSNLNVIVGQSLTKLVALNADPNFEFVALTYDAESKNVNLRLWSETNTSGPIIDNLSTGGITPAGRLSIGDKFIGSLRQFSIWNELRSLGSINDDRTKTRTGNEQNLSGYWLMDEGYGNLAVDKARGRNLTVKSSWFITPKELAAQFDGTNQIVAKSSHIPITKDNDFALEFWFNGSAGQKNATLFSCVGDTVARKNLLVEFNKDGELSLSTNSNTYVIPSGTVLDNIWHHFALSVMRGGTANVYIDGSSKYQIDASHIGGMESDSIAFGALRSYTTSQTKASIKNNFVGFVDEARLWNTALTGENIRLNMHTKLSGNEIGLIAYYPFEKVNSSNDIVSDLNDKSIPVYEKMSNGGIALGLNVDFTADNTPAIKAARSRVKVNSNVTASDNKIVINITENAKSIENCILEFQVDRIMDLNENRMASPLTWTALVNMNRLKWQTESINLTKEVLAPLTFEATISNSSGKYENYVISGLPSWLTINKTQGTINPMEKTTVTFTVDPSTNIGSYECDIRLTGSKNIDEILPLRLKVTGPRPNWSVNPYGFKSSMNVIGKIKIADVYQEDPEDMLAAFIGTSCVGVAKPQYNKTKNSYILYLDIYGDSIQNGSNLTFSLWDASTGRIYPSVDVVGTPIKYTATSIEGTVNSPRIFNATDKIEQQLSLKQGWNWISTNVVPNTTDSTLMAQFKTGIGTNGLQIKSRTGWADYANNTWLEHSFTLDETTSSMYLLKMDQAMTLKIVGAMADPAVCPVVIKPKWNWIGYVPQFVTPLKAALAGLTAKDGDQIKGQIGFATYSGDTWYGSLQYMMPGLGYMYNSMSTDLNGMSFTYPSQYSSVSKIAMQAEDIATSKWSVEASKYQMNMTVTGVVSVDNKEVDSDDIQIAVFVGDECRGTTTLKYIESYKRYMSFLMVWGNPEDMNKKVTFKSFNPTSNQELTVTDNSLGFVPDNIIGSPVSPYKISFGKSGALNSTTNINIYPNPVSDLLHFDCNPEGVEQVDILDNLGRQLTGYSSSTGNSINVSNLVPGVYTLRIKYNGNVTNRMFIRK